MKDPRPGTNQGLFPRYVAGEFDEIRSFDLDDGDIPMSPWLNLQTLGDPGGTCELDNLYFELEEDDIDPPETWFICRQNASIRIYYDEEYQQPGNVESGVAHVGIALRNLQGNGANNWDRRLLFERGGSGLISFQINPNVDGQLQDRGRDTITGSASGITQAWQLASTQAGDTVLLLDRGGTKPRLVPLARASGATTWQASNLGLPTVELPEETHAVVLVGTVDPQGLGDTGTPNIMAIEPDTGRLAFYFYGANQTEPAYINQTLFETSSTYQAPPPDKDVRLLLEPAPDGIHTFYAHQEIPRVWRLPHEPNAENDVYRFTFGGPSFKPSGILPVGATSLWVSVPSQIQLYRVTVGINN